MSWITRRRLLVAGGVFVLLGGVLAGAWWRENRRGEVAWKTYEAKAAARGVKLVPEENQPPLIETENFVAHPIFTDLFSEDATTREQAQARFQLPPAMTALERTDAALARRFPLTAWRDVFVQEGWLSEASGDPAADVLKALERFETDLDHLRGLEERPGQRFPTPTKEFGWQTYPESTVFLRLSKVLQIRAAAHLARQESAEARKDVALQLRLYRAMQANDCLLSGMVRLTQVSTLAQIVWEGIAAGAWNDAELRVLDERLGELNLARDFAGAFNAERQLMNSYFEQLLQLNIAARHRWNKAGAETEKILAPAKMDLFTDFLGREGWVAMPRGWFYQNRLSCNRVVDGLLAQYVEHEGELHRGDLEVPISVRAEGPTIYHFMFSRTSVSIYETTVRYYLRAQTLLQQARLHCRLELYRRNQGTLPATLEELVPKYGANLPSDVMDGKPLRYRRDSDREAVLYSVGPNLVDDQGRADWKKNSRKDLDWVWRITAK